MTIGAVEANYKFKYFISYRQKNTGKMARAQGKHREFGINWSVATLKSTDFRQHFLFCFVFIFIFICKLIVGGGFRYAHTGADCEKEKLNSYQVKY